MSAPKKIRVLELYSGIGGMHSALKESGISYEVLKAMDINTNANKVYKLNFPQTEVTTTLIEGMKMAQFNNLNVEMLLMSPPCQPFTRTGKQKDTADTRTTSFLHVLNLLKHADKKPNYILVENVKGFEVSQARDKLMEVLNMCGYKYQEFMLNPLQFGIPNSRTRYYMIAKKDPLTFGFETSKELMTSIPDCALEFLIHKKQADDNQSVRKPGKKCICGGFYGNEARSDLKSNMNRTECKENSTTSELCSDNKNENNCSEAKRRKLEDTDNCGLENDKLKTAEVVKSFEIATSGDTVISASESSSNTQNTSIDIEQTKTDDDKKMAAVQKDENVADRLSVEEDKERVSLNEESSTVCDEESSSECKESSSACKESSSGCDLWDCIDKHGKLMQQPWDDKLYGPCTGMRLCRYMEEKYEDEALMTPFMIPDATLKFFLIMDLVNPCSWSSNCFTKRYGKFTTGAGSVVQMTKSIQAVQEANEFKKVAYDLKNRDSWGEKDYDILRALKLRYFTPREIANLLCFPKTFDFPQDLTNRQMYMLLGNSINVHVVCVLIKIMTLDDPDVTTLM